MLGLNSICSSLAKLCRFGKELLPRNLRVWITITSVIFPLWSLIVNANRLLDLSLGFASFVWLCLAIFVSIFSLLINAFVWRVLLVWLGTKPQEGSLIYLFLSSNLLKYLPGGIWHFVERVRVLRLSMSLGDALSSVLLEPIIMAAAALLWVPFGGWQSGFAIVCFIPACALSKRWREPLLKRLKTTKFNQLKMVDHGIIGSEPNEHLGSGRDDYPWKALVTEMAFLAFRFFGFLCCLEAFSLSSDLPIGKWLASFCLAWTVGLVVPGAPSGIGVFETTLLLRLPNSVAEVPLLGAVLCYRVVVTLADILAGLLAANVRPTVRLFR